MIQLLDNRLCDYWWPSILPYFSKVDWTRQSLTPELVKLQLMSNKWIAFLDGNCIWIGYFNYNPKKEFFVAFLGGKNLLRQVGNFVDFINENYFCNYVTGVALPSAGRLYNNVVNTLNLGSVKYTKYYELDLVLYSYDNILEDKKVIWLDPFCINNWIDEIGYGIIPRDFVNGNISAYKVGTNFIVGNLTNDLVKKYFNVVYVSSEFTKKDMAAFFYFVEIQMMCRYINCSDSLNYLFDEDNLGVRKLGLTTFERKI